MYWHLFPSGFQEIATSERQRRQVSTSSARHRELSHKLPRHEYVELPQVAPPSLLHHHVSTMSARRYF